FQLARAGAEPQCSAMSCSGWSRNCPRMRCRWCSTTCAATLVLSGAGPGLQHGSVPGRVGLLMWRLGRRSCSEMDSAVRCNHLRHRPIGGRCAVERRRSPGLREAIYWFAQAGTELLIPATVVAEVAGPRVESLFLRSLGHPMSIKINDDSMSLEINGADITAAVRLDHLWPVTGWPRLLTRNEAITALTLAERLANGYGDDDPFVAGWREELSR